MHPRIDPKAILLPHASPCAARVAAERSRGLYARANGHPHVVAGRRAPQAPERAERRCGAGRRV